MGQVPSLYRFVSRHGTVEALFSSSGVDLLLPKTYQGRDQLGFRLIGAQPKIVPEPRYVLPSVSHYLLGSDPSRWIHNVPNHSQVIYREIYSGVDLIFHGSGDSLEQDFRISPGADTARLRFSILGAEKISLTASGDLDVYLHGDTLTLQKPHAYQESPHARETVESSFVLNSDETVQFRLGRYDRNRELVIDPVFGFSTYLAGSGVDQPASVTSDSSGNIYVTGYTASTDFPIVNGFQPYGGSGDAFVSKLDPTGHALLYSTYLGGSAADYGNAIALDSLGNIIVAGSSGSNDFPHVGSFPALTCAVNNYCFFLASLKPDGSALNYAGLIGGTAPYGGPLSGNGVLALDAAGNAYLASVTVGPNFEITPGTLSSILPGYPYDSTFVLKASAKGGLIYSTIVPGTAALSSTIPLNNVFFPAGIAVDSNGQATVAGTAGPGLPSTAGVVQPTFPNNLNVENPSAGFVFQLNATASAINYATYVPGTDTIGGLAVDSLGNSYVTGGTSETNLPVSNNAYQKTLKSGQTCTCSGGFILELNGTGTTIPTATYLGGTPTTSYNAGTSFNGIAFDSNSNVFVGGGTESTDFPMVDPFLSLWVPGTSSDMVLAEMSPDLSSLLFGTFLSSTDQPFAAPQFSALAVDYQDNLLVVGYTSTTDFPTTPGSFQRVPPTQEYHGFVAKLDMATPAPSVCLDSWYVNFGSVPVETRSTQVVHLTNCGNAPLSIASVVSSAATVTVNETCNTLPAGAVCPISLTYSPLGVSTVAGTITVTQNAVISPQAINVSGQGVDFALTSNPTAMTITAGQSEAFTLTVMPQTATPLGSFTSPINFSCSGLPTLAGCTFNPASVTPNSNTLTSPATITTAASTPAGTYPISVSATSGSLVHSVSLSLTVQGSPNFSTSATALSPASVVPGGSATSTITIAPLNGFNANVSFSCSSISLNGAPATIAPPTCSFNPASVPSGSGTLTLTIGTTGSSATATPASIRRVGLFYGMWLPVAGLALIGVGLSSVPGNKKKFLGVLMCLTLSGLALLTSCGGGSSSGSGGSNAGTPAGTYTITVKATAGTTVNTTNVALTVR